MHAMVITRRVVHIVTGVFWAGAVLFINLLLLPSIGAAGPAGGRVMTELKQRKQHAILLWVSSLAVLSGLLLLWIDSGGLSHDWLRAPFGMALSLGGLAALTGFLLGLVAVRPLVVRLEEMQFEMGRATTDALRRSYVSRLGEFRGKVTVLGRLASGCLGVAMVAMAVARDLYLIPSEARAAGGPEGPPAAWSSPPSDGDAQGVTITVPTIVGWLLQ